MDLAENTSGGPPLTGAPGSPIGPPSHHTVPAVESQQASHNGRKCEKVNGLDADAVPDKATVPLDETSLASELDMFDIELQKEFQAASLRSAMPSASNNNASIGAFPRGYANYGALSVPPPTWAVHGACGPPETSPPTVAASDPGKRFSSVAGAYQLSTFTQDLEKSVHLIHTLAQDIRREMQIVGNGSYGSTGQPAGGSAKSDGASPAVVPSLSTTFVEDLRLVTLVVQDINQSYHRNLGSPSSPGGAAAFVGAGVVYPPPAALRGAFPRTSPGGGRSTIDTEVNDSLRRIRQVSTSPSHYHEYEVRPVNPYQASQHGAYTVPPQAPQTQYPSQYFFSPPAAGEGANRTPTVVHYLEHVTLGRPVGGPADPPATPIRALGKKPAADPQAAPSVAYPLAVKPRPGTTDSQGGRNRGPRSRSGKNVAPSNYSAFSECSGGETRSYKSTTTFPNAHPNGSSANITTNCSLSSAVFYSISANILNGGGAGIGNGNANAAGTTAGLHADVEGSTKKGMATVNPIGGISGLK